MWWFSMPNQSFVPSSTALLVVVLRLLICLNLSLIASMILIANPRLIVFTLILARLLTNYPHRLLLSKLSKIGFNSNFVAWIESYLFSRRAKILFSDTLSNEIVVTSGVPHQGSHMGPILFTSYINELPSIFKNSECKIYADDVKIYRSVNDIDEAQLFGE